MDEDSEAEKLSPLLNRTDSYRMNNLALNMDDVVEPIDDADTDLDENLAVPEKSKNYGRKIYFRECVWGCPS